MKGFGRFLFHAHEMYQKTQRPRFFLFWFSTILCMVAAAVILIILDNFIRLPGALFFVLMIGVPVALMYWLFYGRTYMRARAEYLKREAQMQESDEQEPSNQDTLGD